MKFNEASSFSIEDILKQLQTNAVVGLSSDEVRHRQEIYGFNEIKSFEDTGFSILVRQIHSPFIILLIIVASASFFLENSLNSLFIFIVVLIVVFVGFYQEYKAFSIIRMLKKMVIMKTRVIRNGIESMVTSTDVVPGDIVVFEAGDVITADVRFIKTDGVLVDQSVLTGESNALVKDALSSTSQSNISEASNIGFAGTSVLEGKGLAVIYGTGNSTESGRIHTFIQKTEKQGPFQKIYNRFSHFLMLLAVATIVAVLIVNIFFVNNQKHIIDIILFALSLGVGIVPEEFPLVTMLVLVRGARILAGRGIAIKRLNALNDLASMQVLCVDKTGTITENRLVIQGVASKDEDHIRESAPAFIHKARELGINIKILSGDQAHVSMAVAQDIGITVTTDTMITGAEFSLLNELQKKTAAENMVVFARFSPQDKYELVKILQKKYSVGYLGDGINDAPALKCSDVALVVHNAVGIAQQASDIILLTDNLATILDTIIEGRKAFINITKYVKTTLAANLVIYYMIGVTSFFVDFYPMLSLQIIMVNLLSDMLMIAIVTDNVDSKDIGVPTKFVFTETILLTSILSIIGVVFYMHVFFFFAPMSAETLQTNWFSICLIAQILFIFTIRTRNFFYQAVKPSIYLSFVCLFVGFIAIILPHTTLGHMVFSFMAPNMSQLFYALSLLIGYFIATELCTLLFYRKISPYFQNN